VVEEKPSTQDILTILRFEGPVHDGTITDRLDRNVTDFTMR